MRLARDGFVIEVHIQRGQPLPDWYLDEPPLSEYAAFFLRAFDKLSSCRSIGFSEGPIPWTAVNDFAVSRGLDTEMTKALETVIMALDRAYLTNRDRDKPRMAKFKERAQGG